MRKKNSKNSHVLAMCKCLVSMATHNVILKNWVVPTKSIIHQPLLVLDYKEKMSREMRFPTIDILTSVYSDEPLQPLFKLKNSKWCSVSSLTIIEHSSD